MNSSEHMLEINKPSELSQILFVAGNSVDSYDLVKITPGQIDIINCIYYYAREMIVKEKINIEVDGATTMTIPLSSFSNVQDKYKGGQFDKIVDDLNAISNIKIVINSLGKNKEEETMLITRFILEMEISRHRRNLHKKTVTLLLSNKLIRKFIDVRKCFAKMFLKIQFSMSSKYSKLLYELLKDYEGIKTLTTDLLTLTCLLNDLQFKEWSIFRANVLERAIAEINEKSDIMVSYVPIKEKIEGHRKQVTKIKFMIEKQSEKRLLELGVVQAKLSENKFYSKSKLKLDKLIKGGYVVIDEEMWIETDIKKNEAKYDAEMRLDMWMKQSEEKDEKFVLEALARYLNSEDPSVFIDSDYIIKSIYGREALTRNAIETVEKVNDILSAIQESEIESIK